MKHCVTLPRHKCRGFPSREKNACGVLSLPPCDSSHNINVGDFSLGFTLIHFLTMFINNGSYNSQEILKSDTVSLMLTPQLPFNQNLGLIWWKSILNGRTVWGHSGSDYGARAQMHFEPETKIGVVVLTNGESNTIPIVNRLFDYAETLIGTSKRVQSSFGLIDLSIDRSR